MKHEARVSRPARKINSFYGDRRGLGRALEAAASGLSVALSEQGDFTKGTPGRNTKPVHRAGRYQAHHLVPGLAVGRRCWLPSRGKVRCKRRPK